MKLGIDYAKPDSERTVIGFNGIRHKFKAGDRFSFGHEPRSVRHFVDQVVSPELISVLTYRRPSRGFAKHLRRLKAKR
jgi:hypothetical protein